MEYFPHKMADENVALHRSKALNELGEQELMGENEFFRPLNLTLQYLSQQNWQCLFRMLPLNFWKVNWEATNLLPTFLVSDWNAKKSTACYHCRNGSSVSNRTSTLTWNWHATTNRKNINTTEQEYPIMVMSLQGAHCSERVPPLTVGPSSLLACLQLCNPQTPVRRLRQTQLTLTTTWGREGETLGRWVRDFREKKDSSSRGP